MQILYAYPIVGAIFAIVGILSLLKVNRLKPITSFPFGPKYGALAWIGIGLLLGAVGEFGLIWGSIAGGAGSTASIITGATPAVSNQPIGLNCYVSGYAGNASTNNQGVAIVTDPNDRTHTTVTITSAAGAASAYVNGTVTCNINNPGNYAGALNCAWFGGSFRNQGSTSDQNLYYILATGTTKSLVPGLTYQQTAYLKSGSIATTSDNQEVIPIAITNSQGTPTVQAIVGYYATLTSATQLGYLNNQNSVDSQIKCDTNGDGSYDTAIARLTVTKIAA